MHSSDGVTCDDMKLLTSEFSNITTRWMHAIV